MDDAELPKALIKRIAKTSLTHLQTSEGKTEIKDIQLSKDAILALAESARVFINYLTATGQFQPQIYHFELPPKLIWNLKGKFIDPPAALTSRKRVTVSSSLWSQISISRPGNTTCWNKQRRAIPISHAGNDICKEAKRQIISIEDVFTALEDLEFAELLPPLKESLEGRSCRIQNQRTMKCKGNCCKEETTHQALWLLYRILALYGIDMAVHHCLWMPQAKPRLFICFAWLLQIMGQQFKYK